MICPMIWCGRMGGYVSGFLRGRRKRGTHERDKDRECKLFDDRYVDLACAASACRHRFSKLPSGSGEEHL